ncbi:hypothetical protein V6N11_078930 [Hibiscus sabdariffa]|uniref:Disease resistance protein RGA3 n=1 Tax=Hibiscus sabdariffa TaxID=183260 RepID=A0ABR2RU82_9ROSI
MAEQIAFDMAKWLLSELSSPVLQQLGLWWNFKDDLEDLKSIVSTISAVLLDAEEKSVASNLVEDWLAKLKDALYDAEDLLDDVRTEALRKELMSGNKLTKEVRVFFSRSNQFAYGLKMGRRIKAIKAGFTSIQSQISFLNLVQRDHALETSFMANRRRQTHSFVSKGEIIGRDNDKAALLKLLLDTEFESEENVVIVPIVGIGGLGKTALAQFVYNDEMIKDHFELRMWVCVSDVFDVKVIVGNIIKSVTNKSPQNLEMDQLQKKLRDKIDGKKYLLVLDDIWNEEREQWFSLKKLLMGGTKGSRIIVTTHSRKVAKITSKCQPYELRGLSDDDAWSLFKEIAFEQRSADLTNSTFVEIGKHILKKCGGVPLVIKTIAESIHKLKHLRYLDLSENENLKFLPNSICKTYNLQVLKLDYCEGLEELPKKIEKLVNLIHLSCRYCRRLTHMPRGIGKLTSLQTLSWFVVDKHGSHGAAAANLSELSGLNSLRGELRIKNLGFQKNAKEEFKAANLKGKQHLQSLVLEWGGAEEAEDDDDDEEKSLEDLQPHPNLKELWVKGWRGDAKFPTWLSLLTSLTTIDIWGPSKFKHLPSFAQLPHLKALCIDKLTELEYMEDSDSCGEGETEPFFLSLTSLELRQCPNMKSWWKRPIDNEELVAFPCLSYLEIEDCPLSSMPLYPSVDEGLRLVNTSSRPLKQTIKMNITASTSYLPLSKLKSFHVENIEELDPNMLQECLQNMTSLKEWGIGSCHWLKSLSGWLQQMKGLTRLTIAYCKELDLEGMQWEPLRNLSRLVMDNLPQLVSLPLWLQHLTSLQSLDIINCTELKLSADGVQIFQHHTSLRSLYLENIPKCLQLPEWLPHLTNLKELYLLNLPNLTSLPEEMRSLTSLEGLYIIDIPQLQERCQKDIGADWHKIAHIPRIRVNGLPKWLQHLTNLTRLELMNLPNLASLPDEMQTGAIATKGHLRNLNAEKEEAGYLELIHSSSFYFLLLKAEAEASVLFLKWQSKSIPNKLIVEAKFRSLSYHSKEDEAVSQPFLEHGVGDEGLEGGLYSGQKGEHGSARRASHERR